MKMLLKHFRMFCKVFSNFGGGWGKQNETKLRNKQTNKNFP